ncbi:MAG: LuxR C-terminal-related transcriptional regulator [Treponema sp.]|nr:LuxR C-terminal-related transcriptional regulator [Treponema sp.]
MKKTKEQKDQKKEQEQFFLDRPRIDRLLEEALYSHVVTVVAGEGCGKTYAVHSFLQKDPRDVIWVQLSGRDNLGWRFWENYTEEVRLYNPEAGKLLVELGFPETPPQFERFMTIINEKVISPKRYVLVFDDFHLVKSSPVLRFMEKAMTVPVSKNNIVLISRTEPEINTIAFLAKGFLSQITAEDLRFSEEEIGEYFRFHHIPLEAGELTRICRDTEGWALAVGLILQEMKARQADGESRRLDHVADPVRKIIETIFQDMDGELRKFLIKLSLIEHWPRNLLDTLDPEGNNISAMEQLSALIRYDRYLHGYRIHHLFLDSLREKQGELSPEEIQEVYAKGARWCIENNLPTDAAVDYERARDYGGLVRLVNSLPRIPPNTVASFFIGILESLAAENTEAGENEDLLFLRFIVRPRFLMCLGRFEESAGESREAIKQFEARPPSPLRSQMLSAAYNNLGTLIIQTCRHTKNYNCTPYFERGYHYYLENPDLSRGQKGQSNLSSYILQVGYPTEPGEIEKALDIITPAIAYASSSMNGYLYGADLLGRAELAYYQGDINKAENFFRQAVYRGREKKQYEVENRALFYLMRICIHTGSLAEILKLRRQLDAQLEIPEYLNRYTIHDIGMGRFYVQIGETGKIAPWIRDEREEGELNSLFHNFNILVKAQCLFAEKQYAGTLRTLGQEKDRRDLGSFLLGKLEITALEAAARFRLGEEEAFAALEDAYQIAAPNKLNMPFIELGEDMRDLARAALARKDGGIPRPWLETIQVNASAYAKKLSAALRFLREGEEGPGTVFLNSKERAVLEGLSQGFTRGEIARRGGLSVGTIKPLIKRVYEKLGAVNRADAVRIASTSGLLRPGKAPRGSGY